MGGQGRHLSTRLLVDPGYKKSHNSQTQIFLFSVCPLMFRLLPTPLSLCIYIQNCPRESLGFKEIAVDFEHQGCLERQRLSVEISRGRVPLDSGIGTSGLGWWVVWVSWA